MNKVIQFLLYFLIYFLLTFSFQKIELTELVIGFILALILTVLIPFELRTNKILKRFFYFLKFLLNFFIEMTRANIDVAKRVVMPRIPLKPGIIRYPLTVKSDIAKYLLANSITLTPGTLSVELSENNLYIHCIDISGTAEEIVARIKNKFEIVLREVFE